jgi:hypothetical protein
VFKKPLLRRAHRGTIDLEDELRTALAAATLWTASLPEMLEAFRAMQVYPDIDTAVDAVRSLITSNNGPLYLALAVEHALRANPGNLGGEDILMAVMAGVQKTADADDTYDHAQVAGAVLLALSTA